MSVEYRYLNLGALSEREANSRLNATAADGWELISEELHPMKFLFQRETVDSLRPRVDTQIGDYVGS